MNFDAFSFIAEQTSYARWSHSMVLVMYHRNLQLLDLISIKDQNMKLNL